MYKIKIDDGYCEYEYALGGSTNYSIQNLIDLITNNTTLTIESCKQTDESIQQKILQKNKPKPISYKKTNLKIR